MKPVFKYLAMAVRNVTVGHIKFDFSDQVNLTSLNSSLLPMNHKRQCLWGYNTKSATIYKPELTNNFIHDLIELVEVLGDLIKMQYSFHVFAAQLISNGLTLSDGNYDLQIQKLFGISFNTINSKLQNERDKWLNKNSIMVHSFEFEEVVDKNIASVQDLEKIAKYLVKEMEELKAEHDKLEPMDDQDESPQRFFIEGCFINHFRSLLQLPHLKPVEFKKYLHAPIHDNAHFSSDYFGLFFTIQNNKSVNTMAKEGEKSLRLHGIIMNDILNDIRNHI